MAKLKKTKKSDWEVIDTPYGQWEYPGAITRIPSNNITMQGVPYPVLGVSNTGHSQMMYPNQDYQFEGSSVTEYPMMQNGGLYQIGGNLKTQQINNQNMKKKSKLKKSSTKKMQQGGITDWWMTYGGYLPMAQDGDLILPPSMLQPVDPTQLPLRQGVAEQVPFTIRGEYSTKEVKEKAAPKYVGLVDYLASKGMAADKESRKALAKKLGIKDYDFSAAKNTELLKLLKSNDKINKKVAGYQQYTFPEFLSNEERSTSSMAPPVSTPIGIPKVGGHAEVPQGEGQYSQRYYDLQRIISSGGLRDVPRSPHVQVPIYPSSGVRVGQMINTPYAEGGCMECGGKMQVGGNVSIKQIEKDAKWKPSDKKYIPLPPAPIVDYPPSYTIDETLPPVPPQSFNYPVGKYNLPGTYVQTPEFEEGGWIQKATASIKRRGTEGKCTPITKPGCTGRAKTLAKTFKKMAKSRKKEDGGYAQGEQYEMDDAQIAKLRAMGYKIKEV